MVFGFPVKTGKLVLNARTETAKEKPLFKESWNRRRCIVPSSWYYEWEHPVRDDGKKITGDKYMFQTMGSPVTWMCGLYRIDEGFPYFVILTREAAGDLKNIHDRMPLILPGESVSQWINPAAVNPEELLNQAITELMYEKVRI